MSRDMQLMELGWECGPDGARLPPDGEWMPVAQARIVAGLDKAPVTSSTGLSITTIDLASERVAGTIRTPGGVDLSFSVTLEAREKEQLLILFGLIESRLRADLRSLE